MKFRPLRTFLVHIWVSSVAGAALIAGLAMGYFSWITFIVAGFIGLVIGVPAGLANARYLRLRDYRRQQDADAGRAARPGATGA